VSGKTVWLASYPKSGNTWFRAFYSTWATGAEVDLGDMSGGIIASSRSGFDSIVGVPSSLLTPEEIESIRPRVDELIAAEATEALIRKIHDGYTEGPGGEPLVSTSATRSAIYIIRDPRDVAISYAHHEGMDVDWGVRRLASRGAAGRRGRGGLSPQFRQRLGSWSEHVRGWVDVTPFPVEVLRYEDFVSAPVATFSRGLRSAGLDGVDEASVAAAVERASFARLRDAEARDGFRESTGPDRPFFRRGQAGAWRDELSLDQAARIEAEHGEVMARFGYL
jgi:aryl sulfotransferase